jgi:hypothetical protein
MNAERHFLQRCPQWTGDWTRTCNGGTVFLNLDHAIGYPGCINGPSPSFHGNAAIGP